MLPIVSEGGNVVFATFPPSFFVWQELVHFNILQKYLVGGKTMKSVGVAVWPHHLESVSTKIKLFNGQEWQLRKGFAVRLCYLFVQGKQVGYECDRKELDDIFPKIKVLFDIQGNVIAERSSVAARLLTTRKNQWLSCKTKVKPTDPIAIYQLIERVEDEKFAKEMLDHFYAKKDPKREKVT